MTYGPETPSGGSYGECAGGSYGGPPSPTPPRSRRPLWWSLGALVVLIIIIVAGVFSCSPSQPIANPTPPSPVYPPVVDGTPAPPVSPPTSPPVVPPSSVPPSSGPSSSVTTTTPTSPGSRPPTRVDAGTGGDREAANALTSGADASIAVGLLGLVLVGAGLAVLLQRRRRDP